MTYTIRIPGKAQLLQMEFAKLRNAYADGNIPGDALVTLEHQDFWYSLAELMGDKPTKPLLFPCPQCKQMIRARAIDRGNPITCSSCNSMAIVPNPCDTRNKAAAATAKRRARPLFVIGLVTTLLGVGMLVYPFLVRSPEVLASKVSLILIGLGVAMMLGYRVPGLAPHG